MAKTRGLNRCCYGSENFYIRCNFNIYQGKKGSIYMLLGDYSTELTLEQINDLNIEIHVLENFDYELFKKIYRINNADKTL